MKKILFLFAFTALTVSFAQQPKLKAQKIAEIIEMKLPDNFTTMDDKERLASFVTANKPLGVFVSESRDASLNINKNKQPWAPKDLNILKDFQKATIQSMFQNVKFIQEEVKEINDRKFVIFEFTSTPREDDNAFKSKRSTSYYNYIQYTLYGDGILIFNFNCKEFFKQRWEATAAEMMNSIEIIK